jgi:hypothetical protein
MGTVKTKRLSRVLIAVITFLVACIALFEFMSFNLVKTGDRKKTYILPQSLKARVEQDTRGMDIEQIIDYGLTLTASRLRFTRYNDIDMGNANCVGYARLCASICNQALSANGVNGHAKPVVGYIESYGINWCDVLKSVVPKDSYKNFVKDHDFVELVTESKTYYFDPSIYDVLGKKCLKITN